MSDPFEGNPAGVLVHENVDAAADGTVAFGQLLMRPRDGGQYELCHRDDVDRMETLTVHVDPEDAVELARYDDADAYRPLKTAPNLRHGWRLVLQDSEAAKLALDLFYPARMGAFRVFSEGGLATTSLRETLERQTGMYRVTAKLTDDQADALVGRFCRSDGGCLRTILWNRDERGTVPSTLLPAKKFDPREDQVPDDGGKGPGWQLIPLLCQEACNLLVAEARAVVKGERNVGE